MTQLSQDWDPDTAGKEMAALFDLALQIGSKPIYQEVSADEMPAGERTHQPDRPDRPDQKSPEESLEQ